MATHSIARAERLREMGAGGCVDVFGNENENANGGSCDFRFRSATISVLYLIMRRVNSQKRKRFAKS